MFAERIARGMAALDQVRPGWRDEVDPESLDLGNDCLCVLGQLFGTYVEGLVELKITHRFGLGAAYGFDLDRNEDDEAYDTLTEEWRQALTAPAPAGGDA